MSREFAGNFYQSRAWRKCRESYLKKVGGLCELCLKQGLYTPAAIVHHKIFLNESTIKDPNIALSHDNLQAVCHRHHEEIHENRYFLPDNRAPRRYDIAPDGTVLIRSESEVRKNRKGDPISEKKR